MMTYAFWPAKGGNSRISLATKGTGLSDCRRALSETKRNMKESRRKVIHGAIKYGSLEDAEDAIIDWIGEAIHTVEMDSASSERAK